MVKMTRGLRKDELEQVFQRRLIYDGHGTGEDKRLVNIIKSITKLCLDPTVDFKDLSSTILKDISSALVATEKRINLIQYCDRTYIELEKAIQAKKEDIECIKSGLSVLELELKFAEKLKKVTNWPDCHTTEQTMKDIQEKNKALMLKLDKQRVNIKTLAEACTSLAKILDDDCEMDTS